MNTEDGTGPKLRNIITGLSNLLLGQGGQAPTAAPAPGVEEIRAWLVAKLSTRLDIAPDQLYVDEPLSQYGLDSRTALTLAGELEDWLGRDLSPTLVWDYPTIEELAQHLAAPPENSAETA